MIRKIASVLFVVFIFVIFFNGYSTQGPSRKKFKKLEGGEVDLTAPEAAPEVDRLKGMMGDRRLREWAKWWQGCATGFSLDSMEDMGQAPIYDEKIESLTSGEIGSGPSGMFYMRSPDGKMSLNPFWGRLLFKKEGDAWQPYVELPCGAALYKPAEKWARNILDCSALEGIDDAYWKNRDTAVIMGYTSVTRQMNVECETVESCVAPTVWIVDLKSGNINEHRGKLLKRSSCELGGYLKIKLPRFFGKEK